MSRGESENKLITRDEVEKCLLEATVGPKAAEIKDNALKWKAAAEAAVAEGGSSDINIQAFVDEIKSRSVAVKSEKKAPAPAAQNYGVADDLAAKATANMKAGVLS